MSEAKHTPGPWSRDKYGHVVDANGKDVRFRSLTILSSASEEKIAEAEASTSLIAAAPDMLTFAQWIAERHDEQSIEGQAARAVIARAVQA